MRGDDRGGCCAGNLCGGEIRRPYEQSEIGGVDRRRLDADKSLIGAIEKGIRASDLGLNPMNDGQVIRVPIPPLTEERRKDLVKVAKHAVEEGRVAIRLARRDANDTLKELLKEKEIAEDDFRHAQEKVQTLTDAGIVQIDHILKAKEDEIMAV